MNRNITAYILIFLAVLCSSVTAYSFEYHLRGQLSGWYLEARDDGDRIYSAGIRYIPQLDLLQEITLPPLEDPQRADVVCHRGSASLAPAHGRARIRILAPPPGRASPPPGPGRGPAVR